MRHALAIFIISALLSQTFSSYMIMADYCMNSNAYAKNCENKARPMLHCNGKCQMMKRIKQEANKDQRNPEHKSEKNLQVLSSKSFFATTPFFNIQDISKKKSINSTEGDTIDRCFDIFHPPLS